ncbi:MAG: hypothetical protein QM800_02640 [Paludibacter sp.]
MRKITSFIVLAALLWTGSLLATTPGVKSSTAWFNGETFESFTAGTDLKTAGASPYADWTGTNVMAGIQQLSANPTTSTASSLIFGFPTGTALATTFADGTASGTLNISKNAFTGGTLTGYVYIKTAFFFQTYGCSYVLRNTAGQDVFTFGGINNNSNQAMYCTGLANTTVALGNRGNWGDVECVLDLNSKLIKKVTFTYTGGTGSPKSWTDIALTNGTDVKSMYLSVSRRNGLDNTTIGELYADNIQNLTASQTNHQTGDGVVNTTLGVTPISTAMGLALPFTGANTDVDIQWSISDWGAITNQADKDKITLTRSATDYSSATLSTNGAISTDGDITITAAVAGGATLTKIISIKSLSITGVKASLLSEISKAIAARNDVTAANPYVTSLKTSLNSVIDAGQTTYDNAGASIADVTTTTSNLITAEAAFANGLTPYNTYVSGIATVKAGRDTVAVNYATAPFFVALKNTLNLALGVAEAAKDTVASTNGITNAGNSLATAYATFNTDRPAYYSLGSQITTVTGRYNTANLRKGDVKFLQFPTTNVNALSAAINTANTVLINGTAATELNTANTDLATALTTFNSAARVAPVSNYYRIYSYGSSGGDGNEVKKVLFAHKMSSAPAYRLAWCSLTNAGTLALGDSALWTVAVGSANNKYTIYNKALGQYLSGTGFSATAVEYSINEVKSQNGYINGFIDWSTKLIADPNFHYSLNSGFALEVRADSLSPYNNLRATGGQADRYRYAFQFEEAKAPVVSTAEGTVKTFACSAGQTDVATLTVSGDDLYNANIQLTISGTDASAFAVSAATITTTNTYVRNNAVTVTYGPTTGISHSAKLSITAAGGNTLEYNLTGSVLTSLLQNSSIKEAIYASNGKIYFNANAGQQLEVYNALGQKIISKTANDGLNTVAVSSKGIFVVKVGNCTAKVML